ncbi:MAG: S8 family serine peptidase [Planctomycetota bacterium]
MDLTTVLLLTAVFTPPQNSDQTVPQHEKFLEAELHHLIENAPLNERIHVDLVFRTQPDFAAMKQELGAMDPKKLPMALRTRALEIALPEQAEAMTLLVQYQKDGLADQVKPLWLTNVIGVNTTADVILELAALEDVAYVHYDPPREGTLLSTTTGTPTCDQDRINSPWAWKHMNAIGQDMVVAVIDTGTCYTHPDLANNIWVNPGEDLGGDGIVWDANDMNGIDDDGNGHVDDLIGWAFDHNTTTPNDPMDHGSHGSHTSGTVAGDGTGGTQTGVAPGAKIMPLRNSTLITHEIEVWQCMQYAMMMDADVISMSLGWISSWSPDRAMWRSNCDNVQAAGTIMVIAAGNEAGWTTTENIRTPGDVPDVTTVGATNCSDVLASFSSIGPTEWASVAGYNDFPYPPGLIKPDISAPGSNTKSTFICSGYTSMSGTSMATPHVAGAAAVLRSLRPDMDVAEVKAALMATSRDLGPAGMDNDFGAGRLDVRALVATYAPLRADVYAVSQSAGGTINLTLEATAARAGQDYWVLASASGNTPGVSYLGGVTIPLNPDIAHNQSIALANTATFTNSNGVLDGAGNGSCTINVAAGSLPTSFIGRTLSFAYGTLSGGTVVYASNPVNIDILP